MIETKARITVVVPIYKVEAYLKKCVDSILSQSYSNLEIILVDDGSPDNCPIICDKYKEKDKRIKVVHKKNGGLCDARNAGLDVATGEYILFIDPDDYIEKNYLETIDKNITVAVMGCGVNGPEEARHADIGIAFVNIAICMGYHFRLIHKDFRASSHLIGILTRIQINSHFILLSRDPIQAKLSFPHYSRKSRDIATPTFLLFFQVTFSVS